MRVNYEVNQCSLSIINKTWFFFFFKPQMFRNNLKDRDVGPGDSRWWHGEELRLHSTGLTFPKISGISAKISEVCIPWKYILYSFKNGPHCWSFLRTLSHVMPNWSGSMKAVALNRFVPQTAVNMLRLEWCDVLTFCFMWNSLSCCGSL